MVPGASGVGGGGSGEGRDARYRDILLSRRDPSTYYALLGMRLEELGEGTSRFAMLAEPRFLNAGGVVHGGAIASVADASIAAALATLIDPEHETMATVEMKINYISPVREGEIVCEAAIIQKGRSVAVGEASVYGGGKLLARAMATFIVKARSSPATGVDGD